MAKYIELIDKYRIKQSGDTDYNPPNYIWADNTGEIVRCEDCIHWNRKCKELCGLNHGYWYADDYCSKGEKRNDQT